ncbi:MAG: YceI family protein [Acidobacteriaceae bacterium]
MSAQPQAQPSVSTWTIDPVHSVAEFKVKHMMVSNVKGQFTGVSGTLTLNEGDITGSRVEATIDASTITTRDVQRDTHLRSAEFLDVDKFPTLTFHSTSVNRKGEGLLEVSGPLTIHGVTRDATFKVEGPTPETPDPWGKTRRGLSAQTKFSRKDFGLVWNATLETGGVLVGDEVSITLDVELVKG